MLRHFDVRRGRRRAAALGLAAIVAAGIGACATAEMSRRAHLARVDLAGLSRTDLEACAGQPVRIQHGGGWEYVTYVSRLPKTEGNTSQCVATFMLRNGYVEGLDYENASGGLIGKNITECLSIVDPCLKKRAN